MSREDTVGHAHDSLQDALDSAYRYLGHRDRTVAEVRNHLIEKKSVREAVAQDAIEVLIEQDYLNDARFAQRFAEDRRALDSWGNERIERKLRELGMPANLIGAALSGQEAGSEMEAAVGLLARRFAAPLEDARQRQRALGVLVRKGYDLDLAYDAIRRFDLGGESRSTLAEAG